METLPLDPLNESTPNFERFVNSQSGEDEDNPIHMANIDIPNLLGRSFLLPHAEEIMSYNQLLDYIQKGTDAEEAQDFPFKFRYTVAHQGPLKSTDPDHKGSKYNSYGRMGVLGGQI